MVKRSGSSQTISFSTSWAAHCRTRVTGCRVRLVAILALLFFAAVVLAALAIFRRSRLSARSNAVPQSVVSPPRPALSLDDALSALRIRRDRQSVLGVREALWHIAGATAGETLDDVLHHEPARNTGLVRVLVAIEHAAFTDDAHLEQAIDDALSAEELAIAR